VEIKDEDPKKKTATVHIFKNELEGKIQRNFIFSQTNKNTFFCRDKDVISEKP